MKFRTVKSFYSLFNQNNEMIRIKGKITWSSAAYAKNALAKVLANYLTGSGFDEDKRLKDGKIIYVREYPNPIYYKAMVGNEVHQFDTLKELAEYLIERRVIRLVEIKSETLV